MRLILIVALMFSAPAWADRPGELFVASADGVIEIGPDGSVLKANISTPIGATKTDFESQIARWRFQPIIENGKPVIAVAHMRLQLLAFVEPAKKGARLGFMDVTFVDPPGKQSASPAVGDMKPPRYPASALRDGVGGDISLLLEMDGKGGVARVGVKSALLATGGSLAESSKGRYASLLGSAAMAAAKHWRFPNYKVAGEKMLAPVNFRVDGMTWYRAHPITVTPEPWMQLEAGERLAELSSGGLESSPRVRLLTDLPPLL